MAPYLDSVTVRGSSHGIYSFSFPSVLTIIPQSFADVPVTESGVDTVAFLKASEGVVGLFGMFFFLSRIRLHPRLN